MGEREGNKTHDYKTKLSAVRDRLEHDLTKVEVMAKYEIASLAPLERWCRDYRIGGTDTVATEAEGTAEGLEVQTETGSEPRAGAGGGERVPQGEDHVPGKSPSSAGVEITNRDKSVIVSALAGLGHPLRCLLRAAGPARSTYYYLLSHPGRATRPDIEPMAAEIFHRTPNGCGHWQVRMCLVHESGIRVSHKSVLRVMRRMGLRCAIRRPKPYRRYSSYRGDADVRGEPAGTRLLDRPTGRG